MNFIHLSVHKTFFVSIMIDHVVTRISAILVILCRKIIKIISLNLSLTEMSTPRPYDCSGLHVYHSIIKHNSSDCVCPGLPIHIYGLILKPRVRMDFPWPRDDYKNIKFWNFEKLKKFPPWMPLHTRRAPEASHSKRNCPSHLFICDHTIIRAIKIKKIKKLLLFQFDKLIQK